MVEIFSEGVHYIRRRLRRRWLEAAAALWCASAVVTLGLEFLGLGRDAETYMQLLATSLSWLALGSLALALSVAIRSGLLGKGSVNVASDLDSGEDGTRALLIRRGDDEILLRATEIERGWVYTNFKRQEILSLELRSGDEWRIYIGEPAEADALLAAVGLYASRRSIRLLRRRSGTVLASFLLSFAPAALVVGIFATTAGILGSVAAGLAIPFFWIMLILSILWKIQPSSLEIGTDGLAWRSLLRGRHFIPHRELVSATVQGSTLLLEMANGEVHEIPLGPIPDHHLGAVARRIVSAAAGGRLNEDELNILTRSSRSLEEWRAALAEISSGHYRSARVPDARLIEVVEDATGTPERRLGAAIALSEAGDEEARRRIRARIAGLAADTANPHLSRAFVELAEDRLESTTIDRISANEHVVPSPS